MNKSYWWGTRAAARVRKKPDTLEGRGAGLRYDARALKIPGPAKLAAWTTSSVVAKVTLTRLGPGGMLFIHDITQRNYKKKKKRKRKKENLIESIYTHTREYSYLSMLLLNIAKYSFNFFSL